MIIKKLRSSWKSIITFAPEFEGSLDKQTRILTILGNFTRELIFGFVGGLIILYIFQNISPAVKNLQSLLGIIFGFIISSLCADDDVIEWIHRHYGYIIIIDVVIMTIGNLTIPYDPRIRVMLMATIETATWTFWRVGFRSIFNRHLSNDDLTKWDLIANNSGDLGGIIGLSLYFIICEFGGIIVPITSACIIQLIAIVIDAWCDNKVHQRLYNNGKGEQNGK